MILIINQGVASTYLTPAHHFLIGVYPDLSQYEHLLRASCDFVHEASPLPRPNYIPARLDFRS